MCAGPWGLFRVSFPFSLMISMESERWAITKQGFAKAQEARPRGGTSVGRQLEELSLEVM